MVEIGDIEQAETERATHIAFGPEKDKYLCFHLDYWRLNGVIVRDSYPIARMDECMGSRGDALNFSLLDTKCNHW